MEFFLDDIVVALILLLTAVQGYRKGFVLTLCGFLAVFVAFIGASILSTALARPVAQMVAPVVEQNLQDAIGSYYQYAPPVAGSQEDSFFADLPLEDALDALQDSTLFQGLSEAFAQAVDEGMESVAAGAVRALAEYAAFQITRTVLFVICFALVLAGWIALSHALDLAFHLPVLSTLNQWGGAAVGLGKGCVLLFIACWLLRSLLSQEVVDQSVLLRFFCTTNPLVLIASLAGRA